MAEPKVEPIVMNNEGEALVPILAAGSISARVFENDEPLAEPVVGYHQFCGASMMKHDVSRRYFVIFCARCSLRFTVSQTVTTYGDLRVHFNLQRDNY